MLSFPTDIKYIRVNYLIMKKLIPFLLFVFCIVYIIASIYLLYNDLPTNRPKVLTILLLLSALAGAYYYFKKMKK